MSEDFPGRVSVEPGQRVAVFPLDSASGATIGYYGTLIGRLENGPRNAKTSQVKRLYRVMVSDWEERVDLADILPLGPAPPSIFADDTEGPLVEVRFEQPPAEENVELRGVYRIRGRKWGHFCFSKNLQMRQPPEDAALAGENVDYAVPVSDRLDATYVLRAFMESIDPDAQG
jgi:hypothetical protein